MIFITLLIFLANVIIATDIVRLLGLRRLSFALLMNLGVLIAVYTILFNLLGLFNLITFGSLVSFEVLFLAGYSYFRKQEIKGIFNDFIKIIQDYPLYLYAILTLLILVLLSAVLLPPNNQDSMSYHLARVVHWMQNKNINYYFTSVDRQNRMGPGAEILILWLQLLSSSDRLANLIQYLAFLFFCISLPDALRSFGIRKRHVLVISVFTISTPMLLLQAATTQNDILAAVPGWALILLLIPIYRHGLQNVSGGFFILTGIMLGVAYMVKPTSIILLLPLIAYMGVRYPFKLKTTLKVYTTRIGIIVLVFLMISGPDLYRKVNQSDYGTVSFNDVFYPLTHEWNKSRFFNVFLAGMHHSPFNYGTNEKLIHHAAQIINVEYDLASMRTNYNFLPHEDYAGNPLQFILFLILTAISMAVLFTVHFKERYLLSLLPLGSFLLLGLFLRDNPWISRIQLPFFLTVPLCFISLEAVSSKMFKILFAVLFGYAFFCLASGFLTVSQNTQRPLDLSSILHPRYSFGDLNALYYRTSGAGLKAEHDQIIQTCISNNFKTIGVLTGPGFIEYPLSWQLYKHGVRLIHLNPLDPQDVDLIYVETSIPAGIEKEYIKAGDKIYLRRTPINTLDNENDVGLPLQSLVLSENASIRPGSIFFSSNGKITTQGIHFTEGNYLLKVKTNGAVVADQGSHWRVFIDHNKIGEINSVTTGQWDTLFFQIVRDGNYGLTLEFDNDIFDATRGWDQNGEIEQIAIERAGPTQNKTGSSEIIQMDEDLLELPLPDLVLENGNLRQGSIFFSGNGKVFLPNILFVKGKYYLKVKSRGALVSGEGSQFIVLVDGKRIGEIKSISPGQEDLLPFEVDDEAGHRITLEFINDMFDPARGLDRNGEIQQLTIIKTK